MRRHPIFLLPVAIGLVFGLLLSSGGRPVAAVSAGCAALNSGALDANYTINTGGALAFTRGDFIQIRNATGGAAFSLEFPIGTIVSAGTGDQTVFFNVPTTGASSYQWSAGVASDWTVSCLPPTLSVLSGSGQTAQVNTAFGLAFQVELRDGNSTGMLGEPIVFTAPGSGASGTFPGGLTTVTVNTDIMGVALSPIFTANGTAGLYSVTASYAGDPLVPFLLENLSAPPPPPPPPTSAPPPAPGITVINRGQISLSAANRQPAYDRPGGNIVRDASGPIILPADADGNGFDTYTVTGTQNFNGRTWASIFIGSENFVWVPLP